MQYLKTTHSQLQIVLFQYTNLEVNVRILISFSFYFYSDISILDALQARLSVSAHLFLGDNLKIKVYLTLLEQQRLAKRSHKLSQVGNLWELATPLGRYLCALVIPCNNLRSL